MVLQVGNGCSWSVSASISSMARLSLAITMRSTRADLPVEGICTCFLAVVAYLYLPHNPASPKIFFGKSYNIFTPREASIIVTRSIRNDPGKGSRVRKPVLASHILETFVDWRLYGHLVAAFLSMIMISGMNTYSPSIIKSLGFTGLQANGLNSVGSACALILSLTLAYSSDRMHERGVHIAVGYLWGAVGLLWLALAPIDAGKWILYGMCRKSLRCAKVRPNNLRWCRDHTDGHGICSSNKCRLAYCKDGRTQATSSPSLLCNEYPDCK
jgi:hypothetical protein